MNSRLQEACKKPYQKPNLKVYGNIQVLTGAVVTAGGNADAMLGGLKTH